MNGESLLSGRTITELESYDSNIRVFDVDKQDCNFYYRDVTDEVAMERVDIISFSGVPLLTPTMSLAFIAQGISCILSVIVILKKLKDLDYSDNDPFFTDDEYRINS